MLPRLRFLYMAQNFVFSVAICLPSETTRIANGCGRSLAEISFECRKFQAKRNVTKQRYSDRFIVLPPKLCLVPFSLPDVTTWRKHCRQAARNTGVRLDIFARRIAMRRLQLFARRKLLSPAGFAAGIVPQGTPFTTDTRVQVPNKLGFLAQMAIPWRRPAMRERSSSGTWRRARVPRRSRNVPTKPHF